MSLQESNKQISVKLKDISDEIAKHKAAYGEAPECLFDGKYGLPPNELLATCRMVRDRLDIIRSLPKGGKFAEVGTLYGDLAVKVIEIVQPSELHIFDISVQHVRPDNMLKIRATNTEFHLGLSWECLARQPEGYFDAVYVDADHSFASVSKDLPEALRVTKPGGLIICNDYTAWSYPQCKPYGVFAAVNKFATENKLEFSHFALQVNGFYDVALRVK